MRLSCGLRVEADPPPDLNIQRAKGCGQALAVGRPAAALHEPRGGAPCGRHRLASEQQRCG